MPSRRITLRLLALAALTTATACSDATEDTGPGLDLPEEPTTLPATTPSPATAAPTTTTTTTTTTELAEEQRFPDVIDATASFDGETWTVSATLSSPYDTPERYADSWRVVGPDGSVYGERFLTHDHANEQPFTRRQTGIVIPDDVDVVTIEGRDQQYGWGGGTFELVLER